MNFISNLLGPNAPLALNFVVAFFVVLLLIGLAAWVFRMVRGRGLGIGASARGRQPRLAVLDYADVDARRKLVLIRRDNVEHLILLGGPTDVVIENNIVRGVPVQASALREVTAAAISEPPPPAPVPE
ncbi:flagellar biosynthetic protein FliO, partial [Phreatobacter sp. AB_2022a]|nr:flagellar biosynthetic protein FliO [Phreatobacter sp. AB_2022a]